MSYERKVNHKLVVTKKEFAEFLLKKINEKVKSDKTYDLKSSKFMHFDDFKNSMAPTDARVSIYMETGRLEYFLDSDVDYWEEKNVDYWEEKNGETGQIVIEWEESLED